MKTSFDFLSIFSMSSGIIGKFQIKKGPDVFCSYYAIASYSERLVYSALLLGTVFCISFLGLVLEFLFEVFDFAVFLVSIRAGSGSFSFGFLTFLTFFLPSALASKVEYWLSPKLNGTPSSKGFFLPASTFLSDCNWIALILAYLIFFCSYSFIFIAFIYCRCF